MSYSRVEILEFANPYEILSGDALAEHKDILDDLSEQEQQNLAVKMVGDCPKEELRDFHYAIKALADPLHSQGTFHAVLSEAYQVKTRLLGLLDHRNKNPHLFLLEETTPDLLNHFKDLTLKVLEGKEAAIAEKLALCTPEQSRSNLTLRVSTISWDNNFAEKIRIAFTLHHNIKHHLLGNEPERFFTSKDFHRDLCLEFSGLMSLIKGHEEKIGLKLAKIPSSEMRSNIMRHLKLLTTTAHDETNPFKPIMDTMNANMVPLKRGAHPDTMFGATLMNSLNSSSEQENEDGTYYEATL